MTVYFIGAGPGDPELLTLKAARLIKACPVCLYAGSLVPEEVVSIAPEGALVMDTAPMGETLDNFGRTGTTLAIHLGIRALREIERQLIPHYGADCPAAVIYRVGWPDQMIIRGTLSDIRAKARDAKITRTALILLGPALADDNGFPDSALYDAAKPHVLRPKAKA